MKILVTGATGFIAGHCVADLLANGYEVRGTVRDPDTARVEHLREIAARTGGTLEFTRASLESDSGWDAAVAGCDHVLHVASPNPPSVPRHEDEVIRPAVDGTLRVLRAAAAGGTVRRVVLTSSIDAVTYGHTDGPKVRTEADWSTVDNSGAYQKSKVRCASLAGPPAPRASPLWTPPRACCGSGWSPAAAPTATPPPSPPDPRPAPPDPPAGTAG